jgi:UDPglucose 6-dehydrogenase
LSTVGVWGAWHLGSVVAAGLAALGHEVWVTDLSETAVAQLSSGVAPVREPGLDDLIAQHVAAGLLHPVTATDPRLGELEFSVIAADVEVLDDDTASLGTLEALVKQMGSVLRAPTVLVVMSQVPVGTSHRLASSIGEATGLPVPVVCMPENLRLGGALDVFFHPDRLVIGTDDPAVGRRVQELFSAQDCPKVTMSVASAEMSKHAMNAYLATCISFMSQLSDLCEAVGADAWDVAAALKADARVSPRAPVLPGLGFAGGTLGRDLQSLRAAGREHGVPADLFDAVWSVNHRRLSSTVDRVRALVGELAGARIGVLGLTYKPGTSTLRRSQSVELARGLVSAGATVVAHDPAVAPSAGVELGFAVAEDPYAAAADADALVLMTTWPDYKDLDPQRLAATMRRRIVFDPAGFLDAPRLADAGFVHAVVGRPA